jgi:hypothetical protein
MERAIAHELGAGPHGGNGHGSVLLDTVGTISLVPAYDRSHTTAERKNRRPAWWLLYIMIPLTAILFLLADQLSLTSGCKSHGLDHGRLLRPFGRFPRGLLRGSPLDPS